VPVVIQCAVCEMDYRGVAIDERCRMVEWNGRITAGWPGPLNRFRLVLIPQCECTEAEPMPNDVGP
jgi:hypothetical protein